MLPNRAEWGRDENGVLKQPVITFEKVNSHGTATAGSSHAHRVWLAGEVRTLARHSYKQQARMGATKFQSEIAHIANRAAAAYLVTQLSGAVVLETDQQYKENDLEPGDPNQVPTVPEYMHFALILGIGSMTWILVRRLSI